MGEWPYRRRRILRQRPRAQAQRFMDRMRADPPKPVLGVGIVALAPVHDAMPVAALAPVQRLTDPVRFIEEVMVEPERGQARAGHLAVPYRMPVAQPRFGQRAQLVERRAVRRTPVER